MKRREFIGWAARKRGRSQRGRTGATGCKPRGRSIGQKSGHEKQALGIRLRL